MAGALAHCAQLTGGRVVVVVVVVVLDGAVAGTELSAMVGGEVDEWLAVEVLKEGGLVFVLEFSLFFFGVELCDCFVVQ